MALAQLPMKGNSKSHWKKILSTSKLSCTIFVIPSLTRNINNLVFKMTRFALAGMAQLMFLNLSLSLSLLPLP